MNKKNSSCDEIYSLLKYISESLLGSQLSILLLKYIISATQW